MGLKQYNLLYGNVLTNALIEEGVEIDNVHYGPLFRGQTIVRQAVQLDQARLPRQTILDWPAYRTVGHLFPYVEKGGLQLNVPLPLPR